MSRPGDDDSWLVGRSASSTMWSGGPGLTPAPSGGDGPDRIRSLSVEGPWGRDPYSFRSLPPPGLLDGLEGGFGAGFDAGVAAASLGSEHRTSDGTTESGADRGAAVPDAADVARRARARRRIDLRLLPLLFGAGFMSQLDRTNLAYAGLQLDSDMGFSRTVHGLASGIFFLGYLAQLPANAACVALGARRWLSAILFASGLVTAAFAAVRNEGELLALRALLGATEAGIFPGVFYQLSLFYDERGIGVAYTWVATSTVVAGVLGAPLAGALLSLDGFLGLRGWQWVFIAESLPAFALAAVLLAFLPTSPANAAFLSEEERRWVQEEVRGGRAPRGADGGPHPAPLALREPARAEQRERLLANGTGSTVEVELATSARGAAKAAQLADEERRLERVPLSAAPPSDGERGGAPSPGSSPPSPTTEGSGGEGGGEGGDPPPAPPKAGEGPGGWRVAALALRASLSDPRVWWLGLVMLLIDACMNSVNFWLPQLLQAAVVGHRQNEAAGALSSSGWAAGPAPAPSPAPASLGGEPAELRAAIHAALLSAIPFSVAGLSMIANAYASRRREERRFHTAVPMAVTSLTFLLLAVLTRSHDSVVLSLVCMSLAAAGIWATHGPFFSWPAALLDPEAAAIGFALIKTLGALGGFSGPTLVGYLADREREDNEDTHSGTFGDALWLLMAVALSTSIMVLLFRGARGRDPAKRMLSWRIFSKDA